MHPYVEVLHKYLEDDPLHTCAGDPAGFLDLLYCCYRQQSFREGVAAGLRIFHELYRP